MLMFRAALLKIANARMLGVYSAHVLQVDALGCLHVGLFPKHA